MILSNFKMRRISYDITVITCVAINISDDYYFVINKSSKVVDVFHRSSGNYENPVHLGNFIANCLDIDSTDDDFKCGHDNLRACREWFSKYKGRLFMECLVPDTDKYGWSDHELSNYTSFSPILVENTSRVEYAEAIVTLIMNEQGE